MAKTEIKKSSKELSEKDENDEAISKCNENGYGILKLNGWKTTLIIVLVSLKFGCILFVWHSTDCGLFLSLNTQYLPHAK